MYNLQLSPEQLEIRDTVRDFVAREIKPLALAPDASGGARAAPAAGRARQGLADGAAHAGAVRGSGRRRRRQAHLLHRHRGARRRRSRHRGGAGANVGACPRAVRRLDDAGATRPLPAGRSWRTTAITWRSPSTSRTPMARSASITIARGPLAARLQDHRACARAMSGSSTAFKDCVANAPLAKLFAVAGRASGRAARARCWCRATLPG